jgi:hypothetical protein
MYVNAPDLTNVFTVVQFTCTESDVYISDVLCHLGYELL